MVLHSIHTPMNWTLQKDKHPCFSGKTSDLFQIDQGQSHLEAFRRNNWSAFSYFCLSSVYPNKFLLSWLINYLLSFLQSGCKKLKYERKMITYKLPFFLITNYIHINQVNYKQSCMKNKYITKQDLKRL